MLGDQETGVAERFRDKCEIHALTKENCGETVSGRIGCERWYSQLLGYFLQGVVAHADDFTDGVGDGKHVSGTFGIVKQEGFGIAVVWIAPAAENVHHLRSDHGTDNL